MKRDTKYARTVHLKPGLNATSYFTITQIFINSKLPNMLHDKLLVLLQFSIKRKRRMKRDTNYARTVHSKPGLNAMRYVLFYYYTNFHK